jgi:hypothetical protein
LSECGRDVLEAVRSNDGAPAGLHVGEEAGGDLGGVGPTVGMHDNAAAAVVRDRDTSHVVALFQVAHEFAHRLRGYPGSAGQRRGPGAVAVQEPEHVQAVGGSQVPVSALDEVVVELVEDQVERLADELRQEGTALVDCSGSCSPRTTWSTSPHPHRGSVDNAVASVKGLTNEHRSSNSKREKDHGIVQVHALVGR